MDQQPPVREFTELTSANIRLGKWAAACELAKSAASLDELDSRGFAHAGWIMEVCGAWRDAADLYRRFAAREPDLLYPRLRLCHVLARSGAWSEPELKDALAGLEAADPRNPRASLAKEMLVGSGAGRLPGTLPQGLWRRWFQGHADWHEGAAIARADLAVVVIGFQSQTGLRNAVRSLLEQEEKAEIVVINSGGRDVRTLLAPYSEHLRIINIQQPLYAGAARNVGIDASAAPYVAFLAGDCIARPGWARTRLARHRSGSRAVASAIVHGDDSNLAMAAHTVLFGARSPGVPPQQALRYGASFDRQVFREFGYFNPALRISEDTEFARRVGRNIHPTWEPAVQTEHAGPRNRWRFALEMYGRGKRAAGHRQDGANRSPGLWAAFSTIFASVRWRLAIAEKIALEILKVDPRRIAGIRRHWLPAALAYEIGGFVGLLGQQKAMRDYDRSIALRHRPAIALKNAEAAARRRPAPLDFLINAADHCLAMERHGAQLRAPGHIDDAICAARFDEQRLLRLSEWLIRHGRYEQAWLLGESATTDLPQAAAVHRQLALAAYEAGAEDAFELAALDALARKPDLEDLWVRFQGRRQAGAASSTPAAAR